MGPLVSVVVPAFNAERFLQCTLNSVSAQTHRELEIILVDDGSTDRTGEIAQAHAQSDPRLRVLAQENRGVAAARNTAIAAASADLVAFVDADDLWHPEKIARQLRRLEERPEAGLVYCWSIGIDETDRVVRQRVSPATFEGDVYAAMLFQNFIGNASAPLVRRICLEESGGFDPSLRAAGGEGAEDRKLYLDIAERHDFAAVPLFLVGYRQLPTSMSWRYGAMLRSHRMIMAEARRRHPNLPDWLYRWSMARAEFYLALRALSSGHAKDGLALCASALRNDPPLALSHWFRYSLGRGLRKTMSRDDGERIHFADSPIDMPIVPPGWRVQHQRDRAAALRVRSRSAPAAAARSQVEVCRDEDGAGVSEEPAKFRDSVYYRLLLKSAARAVNRS